MVVRRERKGWRGRGEGMGGDQRAGQGMDHRKPADPRRMPQEERQGWREGRGKEGRKGAERAQGAGEEWEREGMQLTADHNAENRFRLRYMKRCRKGYRIKGKGAEAQKTQNRGIEKKKRGKACPLKRV